MGERTSGREAALQMIFAVDAAEHGPERAIADFWREMPGEPEGRPFADQLVRDWFEGRQEVDQQIQSAASNWRLERMNPVDRAILRLGTFELLRTETPKEIILDEAVELAKRFGADQSFAFVNGVLNRIAGHARSPAR